jgi:hypothetical protein
MPRLTFEILGGRIRRRKSLLFSVAKSIPSNLCPAFRLPAELGSSAG